jgi:hypothetical protein
MPYDFAVFPFSLCEYLIDLCLCCASAPNLDGTPPPARPGASGSPDVSGAPGAPEGHGPQALVAGAASNDGTPIIVTVHEANTTTAAGVAASSLASEAAAGGPAATTGPTVGASSLAPGDDDNAIEEEPQVVMRHPGLGAPG